MVVKLLRSTKAEELENVRICVSLAVLPRLVKLNFFSLLCKSLPHFAMMVGDTEAAYSKNIVNDFWSRGKIASTAEVELLLEESLAASQWKAWSYADHVLTLTVDKCGVDAVAAIAMRLVNLSRFFKTDRRRRYLTTKILTWKSFNSVTAHLTDFKQPTVQVPDAPVSTSVVVDPNP